MSVFLRYLMSFLISLMWNRSGRGGSAPPLPRLGKKPVSLPVIGPWQMMIGMWLMRRMWEKYGHDVKAHLANTPHPAARGIGSLLPNPQSAAPSATASSASTASTAGTQTAGSTGPAQVMAPGAGSVSGIASSAAPAASSSPPAAAAPAAAAPQDTQPLRTRRLPQGSLLSSLRRSPGSPGAPHSP